MQETVKVLKQKGIEEVVVEPSPVFLMSFYLDDYRCLDDALSERGVATHLTMTEWPRDAFVNWNNVHISTAECGTIGMGGNYVFGKEIAVNGIKILHEDKDSKEPSYVGTAYVDLKDIEVLDEKFNNMWELAKPYD